MSPAVRTGEEPTMNPDEQIRILESMHQGALRLEAGADPLLRGQVLHLKGCIEALLTIKRTEPGLWPVSGEFPESTG